MKDLKELRNQIDEIDNQIVAAYLERIELVKEVGEYKKTHGIEIEHSDREKELLNRLVQKFGQEHFYDIRFLYGAVMSYSKIQQSLLSAKDAVLQIPEGSESTVLIDKNLTVACQGVGGAYSAIAAEQLFDSPDLHFLPTFSAVFSAVAEGKADFGVLPIENSTAGSVNEVYDLLKTHSLFIAGAKKLKVSHCLLALPSATLESVKTVTSHPQGLSQCSDYLASHGFNPKESLNTALAAKEVSEGEDLTLAAIASLSSAEKYGLKVLAEDIQNAKQNYTRFIIVSKTCAKNPSANKISLLLSLPHKAGSLYHLMNIIASYDVNLTKLESRPIPGTNFEFSFYVDIEGSSSQENVKQLLRSVNAYCTKFVYLGNYFED